MMISCEEKNKLQSVNRKRDETQKAIFFKIVFYLSEAEKRKTYIV